MLTTGGYIQVIIFLLTHYLNYIELVTLHRTTLNRATVKRRQFFRRQLITATNNQATLKRPMFNRAYV